MTFSLEWGGRATDYAPELLQANGKPGRMAAAAKDAVWEAVQQIAEHDAGAWARVTVTGWEDGKKPGLGKFVLTVEVIDSEQSPIQEELVNQQPFDLLQAGKALYQ